MNKNTRATSRRRLSPVSHLIGSRVETRRFQAQGQTNSMCTAPPCERDHTPRSLYLGDSTCAAVELRPYLLSVPVPDDRLWDSGPYPTTEPDVVGRRPGGENKEPPPPPPPPPRPGLAADDVPGRVRPPPPPPRRGSDDASPPPAAPAPVPANPIPPPPFSVLRRRLEGSGQQVGLALFTTLCCSQKHGSNDDSQCGPC
jgi:hypothetical protein